MTITVLSDNRSLDTKQFPTEHGLALLLQTSESKILLDTGASYLLMTNAKRLGIDLRDVDYVFLSHGHADHTGGLTAFLQLNDHAKIILSPDAVSGRFYSKRNYLHSITASWPLEEMAGRTHYITSSCELDDGIRIIARIPQQHPMPKGNMNLFIEKDGEYLPDDFRHELALYVDGLLFTGCAHSGLENILAACPWPVSTVVGGFHLLDSHLNDHYEQTDELVALAERLTMQYPQTRFYTSHCTGDKAFSTLKSLMGDRLQAFCCGMHFQV